MVRGETVTSVATPVAGYCRRGIEALVAGKEIAQALEIVERSCSFAGHSHRLAFCQAIEAASGAVPSARARIVRALFAEVERMLARLWLLGMTARAGGMRAIFRQAWEQRETLFDALETTTGERVYWAVAEPAGVRSFATDEELDGLRAAITQLGPSVEAWQTTVGPRGSFARVGNGVGRVTQEQATALGLAGLAARAAGSRQDLRRDEPYGAYADVAITWEAEDAGTEHEDSTPVATSGDVAARMALAAADLAMSLRLTRTFLDELAGADDTSVQGRGMRTGEGRGAVEGPHGVVQATITLSSTGAVERLRLQTTGAALLAALPEVLEGQPLSLAPLVLASLDLCMECVDL